MHGEAVFVACHHLWGQRSLPRVSFYGRAVGAEGCFFCLVEKSIQATVSFVWLKSADG